MKISMKKSRLRSAGLGGSLVDSDALWRGGALSRKAAHQPAKERRGYRPWQRLCHGRLAQHCPGRYPTRQELPAGWDWDEMKILFEVQKFHLDMEWRNYDLHFRNLLYENHQENHQDECLMVGQPSPVGQPAPEFIRIKGGWVEI